MLTIGFLLALGQSLGYRIWNFGYSGNVKTFINLLLWSRISILDGGLGHSMFHIHAILVDSVEPTSILVLVWTLPPIRTLRFPPRWTSSRWRGWWVREFKILVFKIFSVSWNSIVWFNHRFFDVKFGNHSSSIMCFLHFSAPRLILLLDHLFLKTICLPGFWQRGLSDTIWIIWMHLVE